MLFRADLVGQKHVPGSVETNHGSLSKTMGSSAFLISSHGISYTYLGNCWRTLTLEEKRVWEVRAKRAKADHKIQYPEYKFRSVHNKNKDKMKKDKAPVTVEDERRCEGVAQLLLEGKKGEELAAAVRDLDSRSDAREGTPDVGAGLFLPHQHHHQYQHQQPLHRRSSSVPLPNDYYPPFSGITLPSVPFLPTSRAPSPVSSISRHLHQAAQYNHLGHRRSSSAGAMFSPHYTNHDHGQCQSKVTHSPFNETIPRSQKSTRRCSTLLSTSKVHNNRNHHLTSRTFWQAYPPWPIRSFPQLDPSATPSAHWKV
jgi:hypothetical protein